MKRFLVTCVLIMGVVMIAPSMASAQVVGATTIDINLPNIIILHYFSVVSVDIDSAAFMSTFGFPSNLIDENPHAASDGTLSPDLNIAPTGPTGTPASVLLTLQNAWAVRSLGTAGGASNTTLAITASPTLNHATSGSITVNSAAVDVTVPVPANGASIAWLSQGLMTPVQGDVQLNLDLTAAVYSGDYSGSYTLTATVI